MKRSEAPAAQKGSGTAAFGESIVAAAAVGLLVSVWLGPVEGATEGLTSWRAMLWIGLALVWSFIGRRHHVVTSGRSVDARVARPAQTQGVPPEQVIPPRRVLPVSLRWDWRDSGVFLLVAGHGISGCTILFGTGQKRAAANLMVEWLGLGACWFVLRGLFAISGGKATGWKSAFTLPLVCTAVATAGLGIWQHHVELPQLAARIAPQLEQVRDGTASSETRQTLISEGVPLTEPGLTLFERRLRDSREPFGMFALANTLGGLLAAVLIWCWAAAIVPGNPAAEGRSPVLSFLKSRWGMIGLPLSLVVGWCLLLTKSRTALAGLIAGALGILITALLSSPQLKTSRLLRQFLITTLAGFAILILTTITLLATGVWDREVLAESAKSLQYRRYYWSASSKLIAEHPLFGCGPGQFRSRYLQVRSPEASEEIADPHNLWFDAWVNGGLLAAAGVLTLVIVALWQFWRALDSSEAPGEQASAQTPTSLSDGQAQRRGLIGSLAAYLGLFVAGLMQNDWDDRLLAMLVLFLVIHELLRLIPELPQRLAQVATPLLGLFAWFTHLHGAGGFEMPGAVVFGFCLLALGSPATIAPEAQAVAARDRVVPAIWLMLGLVAIALWWPGWSSRQQLEAAIAASSRGNPVLLRRQLVAAAESDPWNPEPWRQLGELEFQQLTAGGGTALQQERAWNAIVELLEQARRRDPFNPSLPERIGELRLAEHRATRRTGAIEDAYQSFRQAHELFPTDVAILTNLAVTAELSGHLPEAQTAAQAAIWQDDLNRQLGHLELWLPDQQRVEMERLSAPTPSGGN